MYKGFDPHAPYFRGVALAFILVGAVIFAAGCVEWVYNYMINYGFHSPSTKIFAGLVVTALGYITLELELIRISRSK